MSIKKQTKSRNPKILFAIRFEEDIILYSHEKFTTIALHHAHATNLKVNPIAMNKVYNITSFSCFEKQSLPD